MHKLLRCKPVENHSSSSLNYQYSKLENKGDESIALQMESPLKSPSSSKLLSFNHYDKQSIGSRHSQSEYNSESGEENLSNELSTQMSRDRTTKLVAESVLYPANNETSESMRHYSSREVKIICFSFGFRLLFTSLFWDHFVHKYHDLLMIPSNNPTQRVRI